MIKVYNSNFYNSRKKAEQYWEKRKRKSYCAYIRFPYERYYLDVIADIEKWLPGNINNDIYTIDYHQFAFKTKDDAMLFKLVWG